MPGIAENSLRVRSRLLALPAKVRVRGWSWLGRRVAEEILSPYHAIGRSLRPLFFRGGGSGRQMRQRRRSAVFFACYDLETSPVTFDFAWFIVGAELAARAAGAKAFQLVLVPGRHAGLRCEADDYESIVDQHSRHWRLSSLLLPIAGMSPWCKALNVVATRSEAQALLADAKASQLYPRFYHTAVPVSFRYEDVLSHAESPGAFTGLCAPVQAQRYAGGWLEANVPKGCRPIVITLRQYAYMPSRNSNLAAWAAFVKKLDRGKYWPVFIPDTEAAFGPVPSELEGETFFVGAAWNVFLRMAVYEAAHLNMFVNNGPAALCHLNPRCRYLFFKVVVSDSPQASEDFLRGRGFRPGETPAFATAFQRWVWDEDAVEVLVREFRDMCARIEADSTRATS